MVTSEQFLHGQRARRQAVFDVLEGPGVLVGDERVYCAGSTAGRSTSAPCHALSWSALLDEESQKLGLVFGTK